MEYLLPELVFQNEVEVLVNAANMPRSTAAIVNRFCGINDLRFGGSCIDKALIPFLYLPEGSTQLLWDPSLGHFALSMEEYVDGGYQRRYFDPYYTHIEIDQSGGGYYSTYNGWDMNVKESHHGFNVKIFPEGEKCKRGFLGRKKPNAVYNMVPVTVPLERAIDHVISTARRYPRRLTIQYNGDNYGETVSIHYDPEADALLGKISSIFRDGSMPAPAEVFLGMQDRFGFDTYGLLEHFRETWARIPIMVEEFKRRGYYD